MLCSITLQPIRHQYYFIIRKYNYYKHNFGREVYRPYIRPEVTHLPRCERLRLSINTMHTDKATVDVLYNLF